MDGFEYEGIWWLPDNPQKQISGTLRFTPEEGATLDLIGTFKDSINEMLNPDIILGISSNGKEITLYKCFEIRSNVSFPGLLTSSFYADVVFVGAHFQKNEDIRFKEMSIYYLYLDEWVNISGFKIQLEFDEKEMLIKYESPASIQAGIDKDYKIFIGFGVTYPTLSIVQKEVNIKQRTYIRIEPSVEKSLDEYWNIMGYIQNFLSLGIMEPVYPLIIRGITEVNKKMIDGRPCNRSVEIYYRLPEISKAPKTLLPHDMLFTFKDISDRFEVFLKNWFEKANTLRPVYDLYFGTLYNSRMYLQHQFLSLIQAIEAYHRRKFEGKYLSDGDYEPIYEEFKKLINKLNIESSFKEALKSKLKYGNEYSLRKRLKDLFEKYKEVVDDLIKDKDVFINKVVDTRNYLTHYDKNLRKKTVDGELLYYVTQQLKIVVEICLLSELGFNCEEIKNLLARNRRYKYVFNR